MFLERAFIREIYKANTIHQYTHRRTSFRRRLQ